LWENNKGLWRISFILTQEKKETYSTGGGIACPPLPPLRNAIVLVLPLWGLSQWGNAPVAGVKRPGTFRFYTILVTSEMIIFESTFEKTVQHFAPHNIHRTEWVI